MNGPSAYLVTSSIVKRYVEEKRSRAVEIIYERAESRRHRIVVSLWNTGEALGVLDSYHSRRLLNDEDFRRTLTALVHPSYSLGSIEPLQDTFSRSRGRYLKTLSFGKTSMPFWPIR